MLQGVLWLSECSAYFRTTRLRAPPRTRRSLGLLAALRHLAAPGSPPPWSSTCWRGLLGHNGVPFRRDVRRAPWPLGSSLQRPARLALVLGPYNLLGQQSGPRDAPAPGALCVWKPERTWHWLSTGAQALSSVRFVLLQASRAAAAAQFYTQEKWGSKRLNSRSHSPVIPPGPAGG